jgi:GrpB-like predicted nucleotidyltransferase (UPF0157 family)
MERGIMPGPPLNRVVPYNPIWPTFFEIVRERVAPALVVLPVTIEHVGSTAVRGLSARPIVDVAVVVPSTADEAAATERLATTGYRHRDSLGISSGPGLGDFIPPPNIGYHHLYLLTAGSPRYRRFIVPREYLRRHPEEVEAYNRLKSAFTVRPRRHQFDTQAYARAKEEFLGELMQRARERPCHPLP